MTNTLLSTPLTLSTSRSIDNNECNTKQFLSKSIKNDVLTVLSAIEPVSATTTGRTMKPKPTIIGMMNNKNTPVKKEVITKHQRDSSLSLRRNVSLRVTNEDTNHSLRSLQQQQQPKLLLSTTSSTSASTPGIHEYTVLESSYQPNEYDVIINEVNGNFQSNDSYDQYVNSILPSYIQKIHEVLYDEQFTAIHSLNEYVMKNGGKFLRTSNATSSCDNNVSWIHVSPMMAQMYTYYRLKCAMSQLNSGLNMEEDNTSVIVDKQHQSEVMTEDHINTPPLDHEALHVVENE